MIRRQTVTSEYRIEASSSDICDANLVHITVQVTNGASGVAYVHL